MEYTEETKKYLRPHQREEQTYLLVSSSEEYPDWWQVVVARLIPRTREDQQVVGTVDGQELTFDPYTAPRGVDMNFPRRALEVRKSRKSTWPLVASTDTTIVLFHEVWGRDGIIFLDEDAEIHYQYVYARFHAQNHRAELQAGWKVKKEEVPVLAGYRDHPERPLADYQRLALNLSQGLEGYALFMDKGTGKTATSIARIMFEKMVNHDEERAFRVLVVCPNQVRVNWQEEFGRFSIIPGRVTVMRGGHLKRIKQLTHAVRNGFPERQWTALITGYDTVRAEESLLMRVPWDLVILDESHYIRNRNTKRSKALHALRDICDSVMILTGSPIANSPMDLWSQLEFLGRGMSGFLDFKNFATFFGSWKDTGEGSGIKKLVGLKNVPLLQERLARVSYQVTKEEAGLNLPDKVYDVYEVEMTPLQEKMYKQLATQLKAEIELELEGSTMNRSMQVNHVLTKLLRLAQITSGYMKVDPEIDLDTGELKNEAEVIHFGENPKVEAVLTLLEEADPDCKVIIWTRFRDNIHVIGEALEAAGHVYGAYYGSTSQAKREEYKDRFNKDPKFRILLANPATAAEGLDLLGYDKDNPDAASTYCGLEIFFNSGWSAVERSQAEDRAHRRGTRMPVQITDLVVPGTIDVEIRDRVLAKLEMADLTLNIDRILENVLQ